MNKGGLPREVHEKFKNDEYISDNPVLVLKFKKRSAMLLKEIEIISLEYRQY
jgi:hypothetical protein